jgi:uncharacterized membrane protein
MDIIWFLAFIGTFVSISGLKLRIADLEKKVKAGASAAPTPQAVTPVYRAPDTTQIPVANLATPTPVELDVPTGPSAGDQFIAWVKEDWLLKLGALLLLMGVGWFISYAFINNWIGQNGRIALGVVLGALLMALGAARIAKQIHQGEIFIVTGATTTLFTLYAARSVYDMFTPAFALGCMFIIAVVVAALSVYRNSNPLALSSLIMALMAPLFVASTLPNYVGLFMYLVAVIVGTMWVVALRQQRTLVAVALFGVWWYSAGAFMSMSTITSADQTLLYALTGLIAAIFFVSSVLYFARSAGTHPEGDARDALVAIAIGALVYAWGGQVLAHDAQAEALLGWATLFIVGALYTYTLTKRPEPLYLFGGVGAMLLGIAASIQFDGHRLANVWTLEAVVLVVGTLLLTRSAKAADRVALVFVVPFIRALEYWNFSGVQHLDDAAVLALLSAALLLAGGLLATSLGGSETSRMSPVLISFGVLHAFGASAAVWHGAALTMVWTFEATAVVVAIYALSQSLPFARVAAFTFILPMFRSVEHMTSASWDQGIVHMDALALLLLATSLLAVGVLLRTRTAVSSAPEEGQEADMGVVAMTIGSLYYYIVLWLAAPTLFGHQFAVMGALIIYTLVGLGFYLSGRMHRRAQMSVYGGAVLAFVVIRLLLVDVWQMELSGRIVTFLLIGTLLMATAFIGRAPKNTTAT